MFKYCFKYFFKHFKLFFNSNLKDLLSKGLDQVLSTCGFFGCFFHGDRPNCILTWFFCQNKVWFFGLVFDLGFNHGFLVSVLGFGFLLFCLASDLVFSARFGLGGWFLLFSLTLNLFWLFGLFLVSVGFMFALPWDLFIFWMFF